jgi:ankyrin repeat protein
LQLKELNHKDEYMDYLLIDASDIGSLELIKYALNKGDNIHAYDVGPLRWAIRGKHLEIIKYLIRHGADINSVDNIVLEKAKQEGFDVIEYVNKIKR